MVLAALQGQLLTCPRMLVLEFITVAEFLKEMVEKWN